MVQNADHRRRVEQAIYEREAIYIRRHINVFVGNAEPLLRLLQLGARIIEEEDAIKAMVPRRVTSRASAKFEEESPALREEALQGDGFRAVFVFASAFIPEG